MIIRKTILFLSLTIVLFACKPNQDKTEVKLKEEKVAFFNQKLNLTEKEAELFWPIYNDYWEKKNKIYENKRTAMRYGTKNLGKLSNEEITKYADMYIDFQKQESDLLIEFNEKFKQVLTPTKVFILYQTDYEFKTYLLKQIKNSGNK